MFQFVENFFLFKPTTAAKEWISPPEGYGIEELWLQASDGNKIHAWWIPPPMGKPKKAVLYCHGNGGNLSLRFEGVKRWLQFLEVGVLIFDYPGYGKSLGKPSEQSCYASSKASLDWLLQEGFKPSDLIFYGGSLGGTIAANLAASFNPACTVLVSAFTSFKDMAKKLYPWLPGTSFLTTKLDTLAYVKASTSALFVAHGTADRLVPFAHGKILHDACGAKKFFHGMKDLDHHHSPDPAFYDNLRHFLTHELGFYSK